MRTRKGQQFTNKKERNGRGDLRDPLTNQVMEKVQIFSQDEAKKVVALLKELDKATGKSKGRKTAKTIKKRHGKNFYKIIGKKGGSVSRPSTRYFSCHPEIAKIAGAKGGRISKRGPAKKKV